MNAYFEKSYPRAVALAQCNHEGLRSPQTLTPSSSLPSLTESHKRPNQTSNLMALLPKRLKGSGSTFCNRKERGKVKGIAKAGGCEGERNHWVEYPWI